MADAVPVPLDEEQVEAAERLMDAANRLEVGGIIFLLAIAIIALIAFLMWLKFRADNRRAENERLKIEQQGKNQRSQTYARTAEAQTEATHKLTEQIAGMRVDATKHANDLNRSLAAQSNQLTAMIQDHEEGIHAREVERDQRLTDVFGSLKRVMNELLDRQKGVINFDDAVRIIGECFDRSIKPQAVSIAEKSLRANHWADEAQYIEERVVTELQNMVYHAERGLTNYQLSIDHKLFFAGPPEGPFDLATKIWSVIKKLHISGTTGVSLEQRLQSSKIRVENTINAAFNEAKEVARSIYRGTGDDDGTRRFNTPRPDDPEDDMAFSEAGHGIAWAPTWTHEEIRNGNCPG